MNETPLPDDQPPRPVNVRNTSLAILATLACLVALRLASPVFIPLLLGLMLSCALRACDEFERARAARQNVFDPGAKRSHSPGYGEHLQRRSGAFWRDERAWAK